MRQIQTGIFELLLVLLSWIAPAGATLSDHVSAIEISQTWFYSYPDAPFCYNFDVVVMSDTAVRGISFESPAGNVFNLTYMGSGEWEHAGSYAIPQELSAYGDGNYIFTIDYGGSSDTTTVFYGTPDGGIIPQVTQEPVITNPTHGQSQVPTTIIFAWGQCTDTGANFIDIEWSPVDAPGLEGYMSFEDCLVTGYGPVSLTPGRLYKASLAFNHAYFGINSDGIHYVVDKDSEGAVLFTTVPAPSIEATVDIDPDTLNLKSKGKWITCYIELPESYDVADIDLSSIKLNDTVLSELHPTKIGDYDGDGIADLMTKFNRDAVQGLLQVGEVELTVTGNLTDGTPFEGSDTIRVINPGK